MPLEMLCQEVVVCRFMRHQYLQKGCSKRVQRRAEGDVQQLPRVVLVKQLG